MNILKSAGALLLALTLAGCGSPKPAETTAAPTEAPTIQTVTQAPDELEQLRQEMEPAIAGVVFLGYGENGLESQEIRDNILEKGYDVRFPFLRDLDRIVQTDGYELYCIIPADPAASVDVYQWDAETGTTGEPLYQSSDGEPFLLLCNVSDIMPNTVVTILDSSGNLLELYSPGLSLRDGCVYLPGEDQPVVLDFTTY